MNNEFEFLVYRSVQEDVSVNAVVKDETVWLTQKAMAELFDCTPDNISLHLKNIYTDGELIENATAEEFSVVQQEGSRQVKRNILFYNLDAIISVGYRVNSRRATQFRIWATGVLKEYMTKGFNLLSCVLASLQASYRSFPRKREKSLASLRLLFPENPLCWASLGALLIPHRLAWWGGTQHWSL